MITKTLPNPTPIKTHLWASAGCGGLSVCVAPCQPREWDTLLMMEVGRAGLRASSQAAVLPAKPESSTGCRCPNTHACPSRARPFRGAFERTSPSAISRQNACGSSGSALTSQQFSPHGRWAQQLGESLPHDGLVWTPTPNPPQSPTVVAREREGNR